MATASAVQVSVATAPWTPPSLHSTLAGLRAMAFGGARLATISDPSESETSRACVVGSGSASGANQARTPGPAGSERFRCRSTALDPVARSTALISTDPLKGTAASLTV